MVGPLLRVRRSMRALARGEAVEPIEFRGGDYWKEIADEFNAVRARVLACDAAAQSPHEAQEKRRARSRRLGFCRMVEGGGATCHGTTDGARMRSRKVDAGERTPSLAREGRSARGETSSKTSRAPGLSEPQDSPYNSAATAMVTPGNPHADPVRRLA